MSDINLNTDGLDAFLKSFKKGTSVRVGILGDKTNRSSSTLNNATIGSFHEYGTTKAPMRSFLRMPISTYLDKRLQDANLFSEDTLRSIIQEGSFIVPLRKIGIIAEAIIADAFDTGGFGMWPPSQMDRKTNHQTLVETQQLRNAITSEVVENG